MKKIIVLVIIVPLCNLVFAEYQEESLHTIRSKAEAGEARYQAKLGELYIRGTDGLSPNIEKAFPLLQKSYRQQHPFAAYMLGYLALTGVPLEKGYPEYFEEVFSGLQKMLENGDPEAMLKLSAFYRYGWATAPDPVKANELLQEAADAGVPRTIYILRKIP